MGNSGVLTGEQMGNSGVLTGESCFFDFFYFLGPCDQSAYRMGRITCPPSSKGFITVILGALRCALRKLATCRKWTSQPLAPDVGPRVCMYQVDTMSSGNKDSKSQCFIFEQIHTHDGKR